jgi:hypothetical protein
MKKVVKKTTTQKHVTEKTFEKAMVSIARSFDRVEKNFELVLNEIQKINQENREYRKRALENDITMMSHDKKINDLITRVEKLEAKVK